MSYPGSESIPENNLPPPPVARVDTEAGQVRPESNFRGLSDVQKWKREDWMKKGALALIFRALVLLFSFLTFMLTVTIKDFTKSADLSYVFTIALIVMLYAAVFVGIKGHELLTGYVAIPNNIAVWISFIADQILALMLLSAASSAAGAVKLMQKLLGRYTELSGYKNYKGISASVGFADLNSLNQGNGAIAMAFLGFFFLQSSALLSGYNFAIHFSNVCS